MSGKPSDLRDGWLTIAGHCLKRDRPLKRAQALSLARRERNGDGALSGGASIPGFQAGISQ